MTLDELAAIRARCSTGIASTVDIRHLLAEIDWRGRVIARIEGLAGGAFQRQEDTVPTADIFDAIRKEPFYVDDPS